MYGCYNYQEFPKVRIGDDVVAQERLLRVVEDIGGHLGLFAIAPTYMPQIDKHLGDLLATEV
jgi:homoserine O-acetyltransferase/O-succinyltransferase